MRFVREAMDRIVGYVDSSSETAVQGWIANLDRPHALESIVCRGADGASATFKPFVPRLDVCEALSAPGRYGFAIPTRLLRPLGPVVRIEDRNGVALSDGEAVALPAFARAAEPGARCWLLLHIQKTAGTSVRTTLAARFATSEVALVYPDPHTGLSPPELGELPEPQRAALRLIIGHFYFGLDRYLPIPADYITVIREPQARLRSHYYHHMAGNSHFGIGETRLPTARVVQHGLTDEFDNLMTRMVCGHASQQTPIGEIGEAHVELAMRNIRERFRFVMLAERADEHFAALCATMGVEPVALPVTNTRYAKDVARFDEAVDWGEAMHRNRFDVMLYERIQAEGMCGRDLRGPSGAAADALHVAA